MPIVDDHRIVIGIEPVISWFGYSRRKLAPHAEVFRSIKCIKDFKISI